MLIKPLMPRPKPAFRLYPGPGRWTLDAFVVNNPLKRMTRILGTLKKISLLKILLLMRHQAGANPYKHSLRRNRTVILAEENLNDSAKAKIPLPLALMSLLSGRTRTKIRTKKTSPILSATLESRKTIMPTCALRKIQKTNVGPNNIYVSD